VRRSAGVDRSGLETVTLVMRSGSPLACSGPAWPRRLRSSVLDDAAVDAAPRQFAAKPSELDFRAAVHDDLEARRLAERSRRIVANAELHPHHRRPDRDRLLDDLGRLASGTKHVDHVDPFRNLAEGGVDGLAEQL